LTPEENDEAVEWLKKNKHQTVWNYFFPYFIHQRGLCSHYAGSIFVAAPSSIVLTATTAMTNNNRKLIQ